jgi:hypothetical protein
MNQKPSTETIAQKANPGADLLLAWTQQDIENRIGFKGGRYTDVNHTCAFVGAVVLSAFTYVLAVFVLKSFQLTAPVAEMFLRPGNQFAVIPATLLFCWGACVLFLKNQKLKYQARALNISAVPLRPEFVLTESTAPTVLNRIHALVDHPRHFILLNRIDRALSNLKNIGQVNDVSSILRAQAENDEDQIASSYALLNGFVWAIPVLGFIGTVKGLSFAISKFGSTLESADLSVIRTSLQGVTGGLATAFETTLVALVYALVLVLWITFQQKREMSFLDECNDYCHSHVVAKLRLNNSEPAADKNVS